jgi:hypothetical protein
MGMGGLIQGIAGIWLGTEEAIADSKASIEQAQLDQAVAGYNARQAEIRGNREAGRIRMLGGQGRSEAKLAYYAGGEDASSGSAAAALADSAATTELDAQTVKNNAAREAWGFRLQKEQSKSNLETKLGSIRRKQYGSIASGLGSFASGASGMGGE